MVDGTIFVLDWRREMVPDFIFVRLSLKDEWNKTGC